MKFWDIPYQRPDAEKLIAQLKAIKEKVAQADSSQLASLYEEADRLESAYSTMESLAYIRYTIDTRDSFYSEEQAFYNEINPSVATASVELVREILAHPQKDSLRERWGDIFLTKLDLFARSADDRVVALQQEENRLETAYQKLYASAQIPFDGKVLTIAQLAPYKTNADREIRRSAYEAEGKWFDENQETLDDIYTKLLQNRNQQAKILGLSNYEELSYLRLGRIGYGEKELVAFRQQVKDVVVPVAAEIQKRRFERLHLHDPKFYDTGLAFEGGNPSPLGTTEELVNKAIQMYHELSPETGEFVDYMAENELFDLAARPGKAPGGYMSSLADYKAPFIFSNANGTADDVDTLTHEFGHAFHGYLAMRSGLLSVLQTPSYECCEIHSMSMEFLTSPWHHLFFGDSTSRYQLAHAEDAILFLPYGCMVDEFQHIVYRNENMTSAERNQVWLELEKKYRPWNDFDGLPFYSRGSHWQWKMHIYTSPFYYIDYCLAQAAALQFFAAHLTDPQDAFQRYLALVKLSGTKSYRGLVESAGFTVPFQSGALAPVVKQVAAWCKEQTI